MSCGGARTRGGGFLFFIRLTPFTILCGEYKKTTHTDCWVVVSGMMILIYWLSFATGRLGKNWTRHAGARKTNSYFP